MILPLALARPVLSKVRALAVLGLVSSSIALSSIFLFADVVTSTMTESMNSPDMQDNPFAGIGRMLVQSIHIDPGSGIYMLVIAMAIIALVCYFTGLIDSSYKLAPRYQVSPKRSFNRRAGTAVSSS